MNWDDNWTRALVTVLAGAVGAVIAGLVNAYAANQKVKEVEVQYLYKLRDGYLENARKVTGEVYIPISIALTTLFNSYERFANNSNPAARATRSSFREDFETECLNFLETIQGLFARGADVYLTTDLDERLNDFRNFVQNSLDQTVLRKRRVLRARMGALAPPGIKVESDSNSRLNRIPIPTFSFSYFGKFGFSYYEEVTAAPIGTTEFDERLRKEVPAIKALVKEVTLGSRSSAA